MALIKAGASVRETCINADKRIEEETGKAFKKDKNLQKGKTNGLNHVVVKVLLSFFASILGFTYTIWSQKGMAD